MQHRGMNKVQPIHCRSQRCPCVSGPRDCARFPLAFAWHPVGPFLQAFSFLFLPFHLFFLALSFFLGSSSSCHASSSSRILFVHSQSMLSCLNPFLRASSSKRFSISCKHWISAAFSWNLLASFLSSFNVFARLHILLAFVRFTVLVFVMSEESSESPSLFCSWL